MRLTVLMLLAHTVRSLSWAFNAAAIAPGQAVTALWLATRVLDDCTPSPGAGWDLLTLTDDFIKLRQIAWVFFMAYYGTSGSWSSILFSFAVPIALPAFIECGLPNVLPAVFTGVGADGSVELFGLPLKKLATVVTIVGVALVILQRQERGSKPLVLKESFERIGKRAEGVASRLGLDALIKRHVAGLDLKSQATALAKGTMRAYGLPLDAIAEELAAMTAKQPKKSA